MEQTKYTKLGNLVNDSFTVEEFYGFKWKKWDNDNRKMLVSDEYQKDFRKVYGVKTDKGTLDLGSGQLSSLLEAVCYKGKADINGKTFNVKSNGKSGMDIRYFFNASKATPKPISQTQVLDIADNLPSDEEAEKKIDLSEIPF